MGLQSRTADSVDSTVSLRKTRLTFTLPRSRVDRLTLRSFNCLAETWNTGFEEIRKFRKHGPGTRPAIHEYKVYMAFRREFVIEDGIETEERFIP